MVKQAAAPRRVDLVMKNVVVMRPSSTGARTFASCLFDVQNKGPAASLGTLKVEFYLSVAVPLYGFGAQREAFGIGGRRGSVGAGRGEPMGGRAGADRRRSGDGVGGRGGRAVGGGGGFGRDDSLDGTGHRVCDRAMEAVNVLGTEDLLEWFDLTAITNLPVKCRAVFFDFPDDGDGTAPAIGEIEWE